MIYDKLENIGLYQGVAPSVVEGLRFLLQVKGDIAPGRHTLEGGNYANVDCYTTRKVNPVGYEAHRQYVDIQFLLSGRERVLVRSLDELECTMPYDADRDVAFFRHDDGAAELALGEGYFVVLFPGDAHEPTLCYDAPEEVKKIVVKCRVE